MNGLLVTDTRTGSTLVSLPLIPMMGMDLGPGVTEKSVGSMIASLMFGVSLNAGAALGVKDQWNAETALAALPGVVASESVVVKNISPIHSFHAPKYSIHMAQHSVAPFQCVVVMASSAARTNLGDILSRRIVADFAREFGDSYIKAAIESSTGAPAAKVNYKKMFIPFVKATYGRILKEYMRGMLRRMGSDVWVLGIYDPGFIKTIKGETSPKDGEPQPLFSPSEGGGDSAESVKVTHVRFAVSLARHINAEALLTSIPEWLRQSSKTIFQLDPNNNGMRIFSAKFGPSISVLAANAGDFFLIIGGSLHHRYCIDEDEFNMLHDAFRSMYLNEVQLEKV